MVEVMVSGTVSDSQGKPLSGITVEVLGAQQTMVTDPSGKYAFDFKSLSPAVLRLRASSDSTMIGVKKISIIDDLTSVGSVQKFVKNFTLVTPYTTAEIDTQKRIITGKDTSA